MVEIDSIAYEFERPHTEAGDYIADNYIACIEIATDPNRKNNANRERLASLIRRLNRNLPTISTILVGSKVEAVYESVVEQINDITEIDGVGQLKPLIKDDTRFAGYSGSYIWAN